jgi:hypothetical protein
MMALKWHAQGQINKALKIGLLMRMMCYIVVLLGTRSKSMAV